MKSLFNRSHKPNSKRAGVNEIEYEYDDIDDGFGDFEYYGAEEGFYESDVQGEYYGEEEPGEYYEEGTGEYYEEESTGEYYEESTGEYYEEGSGEYYVTEAEGEYYEARDTDEYYGEDTVTYEETESEYYVEDAGEYYEEEDYAQEDAYVTAAVRNTRTARHTAKTAPKKNRRKTGFDKEEFFALLTQKLNSMDMMDRMMLIVGVAVLVLAIITGSVFIGRAAINRQVSKFVSVCSYLSEITTIGGDGIEAVANAHMDRLEVDKGGFTGHYDEEDVNRQISVMPQFVSIEKDLKIKFTNKKTEKLVPNAPFSVVVTTPDGKEQIWSDDDMDGIIYKTGIAPGKYQIAMETLADEKYDRYIITTDVRTAEVKKEIAFSKVDVENEVKQESEIDASVEDTKKNNTKVESTIKDTVAWVESKVIPVTYNEVSKSTIADPLTLVMARQLILVTESGESPAGEPAPEEPPVELEQPTEAPAELPTEEPVAPPTEAPAEPAPAPAEPTAQPTAAPTAAPTAEPTAAPTQAPATPAPTQTPLKKGQITLDYKELKGSLGTDVTTKAKATGFSEYQLEFKITPTSSSVAKAEINATTGDIKITPIKTGTATFTVSVNYKGSSDNSTRAETTLKVTIGDKKSISLSETKKNLFVGENFLLTAEVKNATDANMEVYSSNSDLVYVSSNTTKKEVRVYANKEGTAVISVSYTDPTTKEKITATCEVVVRKHPNQDTTTLLKNRSGEQIYVLENGNYREARYADYYKASKFFLKGEVKYTGWQNIGGKVYYFTANGEKITGTHVIQGATYTFGSDGALTQGSGVVGIDVSKWNGSIDWNAVKNSGVSYAIIRCGYRGSTNGSLVEDPKFRANIKGATGAGLKVGVYFFSQAVNQVEAVEEASMVLGLIDDYNLSYPVFLDVEPSGGRGDKIDKDTRTAVCKAFCETIQNAGYKAGVYSNKTWLEGKINVSALSKYKIWLAQYAAKPTYTGRYDIWQYTATGHVNGISGNVDMNISY